MCNWCYESVEEDAKTSLLTEPTTTDWEKEAKKYKRMNYILVFLCGILLLAFSMKILGSDSNNNVVPTIAETSVGFVAEDLPTNSQEYEDGLGDPDSPDLEGDGECLEESQMVHCKTRGEIMMKDLMPGDSIKTCDGSWTRVWHFFHINQDAGQNESEFYSFYFNNGKNLKITSDHVFEKLDSRILAKDVQIGDQITPVHGEENEMVVVEDIQIEMGKIIGLYTVTPHIVVNGLCASILVEKNLFLEPILDALNIVDQYIFPIIPQSYFTHVHVPVFYWLGSKNRFAVYSFCLFEILFFTTIYVMGILIICDWFSNYNGKVKQN